MKRKIKPKVPTKPSPANQPLPSTAQIVLYHAPDGKVNLDVRLDGDTIWLTQKQIAELFSTERSVITKHLSNIFNTNELSKSSVCAFFAHTAQDGKTYKTNYYNLDAIISVGYRVNSKRGTQFRIWATQVLRDHVLKGYTINEQRLREQTNQLHELQKTIQLFGRVIESRPLAHEEADGLLHVIVDYAHALDMLDQYDHGRLKITDTTHKEPFILTYEAARTAINQMAERMKQESHKIGLFGQEKDDSFKSALGAIYQTYGGHDVYPSVEEKAAHLLYFVVKNHGFVDGNKRIGATLFIWFLHANGLLYLPDGRRRLADNALVAMTLLIAESKPSDKDTLIKVVVNLVNRKN